MYIENSDTMKYKKILLILFFIAGIALQAEAVLKEKDLDNTLSILRTELTNYHAELERQSGFLKDQQNQVRANLITVYNRSNQNSLMLYSQKPEYIFDIAYACHEATEQYHDFQKNVLPFKKFIKKTDAEIMRYDSLITNLSTMGTMSLSEKAKVDRSVCLALAINIRRTLNDNSQQFSDYIRYYKMTSARLRYLNDYAEKRYADIQNNIFSNSSENYFKVLKKMQHNMRETHDIVQEKYFTKTKVHSQWDISWIIGLFITIVFYGVIAALANILVIRYLIPKRFRTKGFMDKRACIIMASCVVSLAIILGIIRFIFAEQNFIIMASGLLVQYTWLLGVILISLLLRLEAAQIKSAFRIYTPLMVVGFIVIAFRIILIPNDLTNIILSPILLACTIWQWIVIRHHNKKMPKSDVAYTYASLVVFTASLLCAWIGYTLLSVQLLIWWIMQLTCILSITCVQDWLNGRFIKKKYAEKSIDKTWLYKLVRYVMLPILGVYSFIIAIYWAADVFNLSDTTWIIFNKHYINTPYFSASIFNVASVIVLYFIFAYISNTTKGFLKLHFEKSDHSTAASRNIMAKNVVQVTVWGLWLLISLAIFKINNTWLVVVSGGLSTGIGFAMKDIIENIYYGISLMAGRVKIGDYIICDGTRGRVSSISYTSTMVEAIDGSVIAFQNSQLFTKNYKNMTKNHGYELDILEVGVAYGTDIAAIKKLLIDNISQLSCVYKKRPVNVVLKEFGDNSIILKILVWVPVLSQYGDDGKIMECVYNVMNENNIEIPFPQRDVHIIKSPETLMGEETNTK